MSFSEGECNSLSHGYIWTYEISTLIYVITLPSNRDVNQLYNLKRAPILYFLHLILHSFSYNVHVEGSLPAILY